MYLESPLAQVVPRTKEVFAQVQAAESMSHMIQQMPLCGVSVAHRCHTKPLVGGCRRVYNTIFKSLESYCAIAVDRSLEKQLQDFFWSPLETECLARIT
jgi:hypothetical protein